jgi:hypothetical protein
VLTGRISRSGFLRGALASGAVATGAGAVGGLARSSNAAARLRSPQFFGIVTGLDGHQLMVRPPHTRRGARAEWSLEATAGATIWRLREADLGSFEPGEEVIAFGEWTDKTTFRGTEISNLIDAFEGTVTAIRGRSIVTDNGTLDTSEAHPSRLEATRVGDRISAGVLRNVDTDNRLVFWAGPRDTVA